MTNFLERFEEQVLDELNLTPSKEPETSLPFEAISRCFRGNTIEEIFAALKKENSDWANETLELLQKKSPMSLKLTLRLIREAVASDLIECFAREYRVACRRIVIIQDYVYLPL